MTTITNLIVRHIKGAIYVEVQPDPDDPLVVVAGNNGNGKSSTLYGIEFLLRGKRSLPEDAVHDDAEEGEIIAEFDNGDRLIRHIAKNRDTKFWLKDSSGKTKTRSQEVLDRMYEYAAIDPTKPLTEDPMRQAQRLREIVGLDFTAIDAERKRLEGLRADAGRDVEMRKKQYELIDFDPDLGYEDLPEPEGLSAADIQAELDAANRENRSADEWEISKTLKREEADRRTKTAVATNAELVGVSQEIESVQAEIDRLNAKLKSLDEKHVVLARRLADETNAADDARIDVENMPPPVVRVDVGPILAKLAEIDELNRKAREAVNSKNKQIERNRTRRDQEQQYLSDKAAYERLDDQIKALNAKKTKMLADAPWPIPGLGFNEDGVTFNGRPLERCSDSEKIRVWFAIGIAKHPEIGVFVFRHGVFVDSGNRSGIREMARAAGVQVWFEVVGTTDEDACVIIENGMSINPREPA